MPDTRSSSGAPSLNFPGNNPANAEAERAGSEEPEVHITEATATLSNDVAAMTQAIAQQAQQFKDALTKSERDKEAAEEKYRTAELEHRNWLQKFNAEKEERRQEKENARQAAKEAEQTRLDEGRR